MDRRTSRSGTKESDAEAYLTVGVPAEGRYLYMLDGDLMGGTLFTEYRGLVPIFEALPGLLLIPGEGLAAPRGDW